MTLTLTQKEYIVGFILGDSSVEKNGNNCRIRFDHSIKQLAYMQWKYALLAPYSGKLTTYERSDERQKKPYKGCRFYTFSRPCFNSYRDLFYKDGKKIIPENIGKYLTPLALTSWFLDDGSRKTGSYSLVLHTDGYTLQEVECLRQALYDNFSISTRMGKTYSKNVQRPENRGFVLNISGESAKRMASMVTPLIEKELPLFLYKLKKPRND